MDDAGPSSDALSGQIRALRELIDERDKRFGERCDSIDAAWKAAIGALSRQIDLALGAADRAIEKSDEARAVRDASANEFRGQLTDQAATFLPRIEYEHSRAQLVVTLDRMRDELTKTTDTHFASNRELIERMRDEMRRGDDLLRSDLVTLRDAHNLDAGKVQGLGAAGSILITLFGLAAAVATVYAIFKP